MNSHHLHYQSSDAYGVAIMDYLSGVEDVVEIVERDDGCLTLAAGPEIYCSSYEDWPSAERKMMRKIKGPVLDLGAGAGRHTLYLQSRGIPVVAVETSPLAVEACRLQGVENILQGEFTDCELPKDQQFASVLLMGNNLGMVGTPERAKDFFQKLAEITTEDATIFAESLNPAVMASLDDDFAQYQKKNRLEGKWDGQLQLRIRYRTCTTPWFSWLFCSPQEIEELLRETPFQLDSVTSSTSLLFTACIKKRPAKKSRGLDK